MLKFDETLCRNMNSFIQVIDYNLVNMKEKSLLYVQKNQANDRTYTTHQLAPYLVLVDQHHTVAKF